MRRPVKQFELGGQHRDAQISFGAREVWLKCLSLVGGFRQSLERCSLLGCHWPVGGHRVQFLKRPQQREATSSARCKAPRDCIPHTSYDERQVPHLREAEETATKWVAVNSTKVRRQLPAPSLKCRCYGVVQSKRVLVCCILSPAREAASRPRSSPRSTRTKSENKWANARRLKVSASATVAARAAKRRRLIKTAMLNRHSPDESHLRRSVDLVNISSVAARCEVKLC